MPFEPELVLEASVAMNTGERAVEKTGKLPYRVVQLQKEKFVLTESPDVLLAHDKTARLLSAAECHSSGSRWSFLRATSNAASSRI